MHPIIRKTFGGLSMTYYFRQLFFGILIAISFTYITVKTPEMKIYGLIVLNTFLYPYSRFVYENIANFIMGENIFLINAVFMLVIKFFTMYLCWGFAFAIAPIGLIFLYFYHTKKEKEATSCQET